MNTEATEKTKGYVFYDDDCDFCRGWVARSERHMIRWGYHFVPMQADWALKTLQVKTPDALEEMKLATLDGRILGGVDALKEVAMNTPVMFPIYILLILPGMTPLAKKFYRYIANHRHQLARPAPRGQSHEGYVKRVFMDAP